MRYIPVLILLIFSCEDEDFSPVVDIPEDFKGDVAAFVYEAEQRGIILTIDNLIIKYDASVTGLACAKCNSASSTKDLQKIVSMRMNPCYSDHVQRETLIFHELGHCLLGRGHTTDTLANGDPKSIMIPNDITLYGPCVYQIGGDDCDKTYRRTYYLDELFDSKTAVPPWGG
jgi:hypothetical protein